MARQLTLEQRCKIAVRQYGFLSPTAVRAAFMTIKLLQREVHFFLSWARFSKQDLFFDKPTQQKAYYYSRWWKDKTSRACVHAKPRKVHSWGVGGCSGRINNSLIQHTVCVTEHVFQHLPFFIFKTALWAMSNVSFNIHHGPLQNGLRAVNGPQAVVWTPCFKAAQLKLHY